MWFDNDLVSALMESIMMPGISNHSTTMTFGPNSTARAFVTNEIVQSETEPQSPQNEASAEDQWPYSWDPGSWPITTSEPIQMGIEHIPG